MEFHELSKLLPFKEEQVDAIEMRMRKVGWKPGSVVTLFEGKILDGRHRYVAAERVGIEPVYVEYQGDTDLPALANFVVLENCESRHLNLDEKFQLLLDMRKEGYWPKISQGGSGPTRKGLRDSDLAKILGVNTGTISRWSNIGRNVYSTVNARTKVRKTGSPELVDAMEQGDITTKDAVELAELPFEKQVEALENPEKQTVAWVGVSGNDEWYTPEKYIDLAREVMGGIDLDPASCEYAQKVVQATKFYTAEDDGLDQPWEGRVWMNPPYSKGLMDKFVLKICEEYQLGSVDEAIVLAPSCTDVKWFHKLGEVASALCLTLGRIHFYNLEGQKNSPPTGYVFFYFGQDPTKFLEIFESVGLVLRRGEIR